MRRFFDENSIPKGWLDENAVAVGWFDSSLVQKTNTGNIALNQTATFTDADQFYAGVLTQLITLNQTATFTDADQFYAGVLTRLITLNQTATFTDGDRFYGNLSTVYIGKLKNIPNAEGNLTKALLKSSRVMFVNSELYLLLNTNLKFRDWTYLLLDNQHGITELVKVTACVGNNGLAIERGQEYSCNSEFGSAIIKHVETIESILHQAPSDVLNITTSGGIGLFDGGVLEYPAITFTHLGNTESVGDSKVILSVKRLATCCKSGQPPEIPVGLLPYRIIDNSELRIIDDEEIRSISG